MSLALQIRVQASRDPESARGAVHARAREGFFADRHADPLAHRDCHGASCRIAGAAAVHDTLAREAPCRRIYCAGYCDRSPVVLRADGIALGRGRELAPLPEIRVDARVAVVTERVAHGDFHALAAARGAGVWSALERAVRGHSGSILRAIEASYERGRGGGGFPTGAKWRAAAQARGPEKVAIATGDEGDPGAFIDRVLLEADPHAVLEGLALCAYGIGARHGIVYVRSEYPRAAERVERAVAVARALLGSSGAPSWAAPSFSTCASRAARAATSVARRRRS